MKTQKIPRFAIITQALLLACSAPSLSSAALTPITENGVTWSYYYNPDVNLNTNYYDKLPDDAVKTALGASGQYFGGPAGTGSATIVGDHLLTTTTVGNKLEYNTAYGYTPSTSEGITIETRFRVTEMTGTLYAAGFLLGAGVSATPGTGYYIPIAFSTTQLGGISGLDLSEWTTVRFTIVKTDTTPLLSIYINTNLTPHTTFITTTSTASATYNRIRFGDYYIASSLEMDGTVEWDYLRWNSAGAFPPIPEPSTTILLLAGAFLVYAGRRCCRQKN